MPSLQHLTQPVCTSSSLPQTSLRLDFNKAFHGVDSTVDLVVGDMDSLQVSVLNSGLAEFVLNVLSDAALEPSWVKETAGPLGQGFLR